MQKDTIEDLFNDLKGEFDINEPKEGHEFRFQYKLKANNTTSDKTFMRLGFNWRPFIAIAASVVICLAVLITVPNNDETLDLASVSPELSETQDFFTTTIQTELKRLNSERSPLTESIINDALKQIEVLETNYQQLKTDLTESGNDQRVIYAMINNFQNRIDILNTVLEQIEDVKQLKTNNDEFKNTI
jgi:septal ring factor EnvC (AmiA/AmiB activator)